MVALTRQGVSNFADYGVAKYANAAGDIQAVSLVDTTGAAVTSLGGGSSTAVGDGSKNVATAGTREQLAASTACNEVEIVAKSTNTGNIWVGGVTVAANRGRPLLPLQSLIAKVTDLSLIYLDADTNGEGVTFIYYS